MCTRGDFLSQDVPPIRKTMGSGFQKGTFGPGLAIDPVTLWAMERLAP